MIKVAAAIGVGIHALNSFGRRKKEVVVYEPE
jgi:hypothetical protein